MSARRDDGEDARERDEAARRTDHQESLYDSDGRGCDATMVRRDLAKCSTGARGVRPIWDVKCPYAHRATLSGDPGSTTRFGAPPPGPRPPLDEPERCR